jgi:hypothetical protein
MQKPRDMTCSLLEIVFLILFAQLLALILFSLMSERAPRFMYLFGVDYHALYEAAGDLFSGVNPYTDTRLLQPMYTPPFSLCVGGLFHWTSTRNACILFAFLNIGLIVWSLLRYAAYLGLHWRSKLMLLLIASVYYPVYYLVDRGNSDGIMLALLVLAFTARHWSARAVSLGTSVAIKVYSGVFLLMFAFRKKWKMLFASLLTAILLQVPFAKFLVSSQHAILSRSHRFVTFENMSPGACLFRVLDPLGIPGATTPALAAFWALTLLWTLTRARQEEMGGGWVIYLPWLMAFPSLVFPYTGVLLLLLLAYVVRSVEISAWRLSDTLLLAGFVLTGVNAVAWDYALEPFTAFSRRVHLLTPTGTVLLILGACLWVARRDPTLTTAGERP